LKFLFIFLFFLINERTVVFSSSETTEEEEAKDKTDDEQQQTNTDDESNHSSNGKRIFGSHADAAIGSSVSLEATARIRSGCSRWSNVLEAEALVGARAGASRPTSDENASVIQSDHVALAVLVVGDDHTKDSSLSDLVVAFDQSSDWGGGDAGVDAGRRQGDDERVGTDVGLVVEEPIASLQIEGAVGIGGSVDAGDDGVLRIDGSRLNQRVVRVSVNHCAVEGDVDLVSSRNRRNVGDVVFSVDAGGHSDVGITSQIRHVRAERNRPHGGVDANIGIGDGDVVLVVGVNVEPGHKASSVGGVIDLHTRSRSDGEG